MKNETNTSDKRTHHIQVLLEGGALLRSIAITENDEIIPITGHGNEGTQRIGLDDAVIQYNTNDDTFLSYQRLQYMFVTPTGLSEDRRFSALLRLREHPNLVEWLFGRTDELDSKYFQAALNQPFEAEVFDDVEHSDDLKNKNKRWFFDSQHHEPQRRSLFRDNQLYYPRDFKIDIPGVPSKYIEYLNRGHLGLHIVKEYIAAQTTGPFSVGNNLDKGAVDLLLTTLKSAPGVPPTYAMLAEIIQKLLIIFNPQTSIGPIKEACDDVVKILSDSQETKEADVKLDSNVLSQRLVRELDLMMGELTSYLDGLPSSLNRLITFVRLKEVNLVICYLLRKTTAADHPTS